jgi:hypothetical protein
MSQSNSICLFCKLLTIIGSTLILMFAKNILINFGYIGYFN